MPTDEPSPDDESFYVSTPQGIFTASGIWFSAREEDIREYAWPVLEHVSLEVLLKRATSWLRSAQVITLLVLPLLLIAMPPMPVAVAAIVLFVGWKALSPAVASKYAAAAVSWLDNAVLQGLYYVLLLSFLAAQNQMLAVVVGLVGFVLLRWGLLDRVTQPVVQMVTNQLYPLPRSDQALRAFIIRAATEHRVDVSHVQDLVREIFDKWGR